MAGARLQGSFPGLPIGRLQDRNDSDDGGTDGNDGGGSRPSFDGHIQMGILDEGRQSADDGKGPVFHGHYLLWLGK